MLQEIFWGVASAFPLPFIVFLLRKYFSAQLIAATTLIAMSFIYVGFALRENAPTTIAFESVIAMIFFFIALIGLIKDPRIIAIGIFLHGVNDITHHLCHAEYVTDFWPVYCMTIDVIWGVYFYILFQKGPKTGKRTTLNFYTIYF